jgi:hypothetical protein
MPFPLLDAAVRPQCDMLVAEASWMDRTTHYTKTGEVPEQGSFLAAAFVDMDGRVAGTSFLGRASHFFFLTLLLLYDLHRVASAFRVWWPFVRALICEATARVELWI